MCVCETERARERDPALYIYLSLTLSLSHTHMLIGHKCVDNVVAMLSLRDSIAVQAVACESLITLQKCMDQDLGWGLGAVGSEAPPSSSMILCMQG